MSRDLPMPASPDSNTTWPSPVFALDHRRSSKSSSSSRPTRSVSPVACIASKRPSADARPQCCPGSHRPGNALEVLCPEVLKLEQIAQELSRTFGNHDRCLVQQCLATELQGSASRQRLPALEKRPSRSGRRPPPAPSRCLRASAGARGSSASLTHGDQLQPSSHRSLCVVLVGLRIPEVDEDPVAHVFRDEAAKALHGLCDAF